MGNTVRRIVIAGVFYLIPITAAADSFADIARQQMLARNAVQTESANSFGDTVHYQSGRLSFQQEDFVLKGNGPDIRIVRTFNHPMRNSGPVVADDWWTISNAADWVVEIPRLSAVLPLAQNSVGPLAPGVQLVRFAKWNVTGVDPYLRCTNFSNVPAINEIWGWGGAQGSVNLPPAQWWTGVQMRLSDASGQKLMVRAPENTTVPVMSINGQPQSFNLVTSENWMVACLPSLKNGYQGEGFLVVSPDGTKYWFDWMVFDGLSRMAHPPSQYLIVRATVASLMVTRIEDRHGNYVTYSYTGDRISNIKASDGREVSFEWVDHEWGGGEIYPEMNNGNFGYVSRIIVQPNSPQPSVWQYVYQLGLNGMYWRRAGHLRNVIRPDGTFSTIQLDNLVNGCIAFHSTGEAYSNCNIGQSPPPDSTASITLPSGATATYTFRSGGRKRAANAAYPFSIQEDPWDPRYITVNALKKKQVVGPGINATWTYSYGPTIFNFVDVNDPSPNIVTTSVVGPDQATMRYSVGNVYRDALEGKTVKIETLSSAGQVMEVTDYTFAPANGGGALYPARMGVLTESHLGKEAIESYRPVIRLKKTQSGRTFDWQVPTTCGSGAGLCFDYFARPTKVVRSSSPL